MNEEIPGQMELFSLPEPPSPPSFDQATPEPGDQGCALCSECGNAPAGQSDEGSAP